MNTGIGNKKGGRRMDFKETVEVVLIRFGN